ncbi:MAG TPA: Hsp20/alpha crystallin family protein [Candidatus Saccharimonadales bacterium]|nr:Hsp20/alpha crystallin family protein [Candidatus Saccharimonadales bacterium]
MQLFRHNLRDLDKTWANDWGFQISESNAMDVYEENGNLIAEVSLPNFSKNEINVTTDEGVLEVSAEHKEHEEQKDKRRYYLRESSNQYFRRVALPGGAKVEKAEAEFKNGTLKVIVPMTGDGKTKAKAIKVK